MNSQQFMKNSKSGSKKKCLFQAEIFSQLSDSVSNYLDLTAYGLHRDHPPA